MIKSLEIKRVNSDNILALRNLKDFDQDLKISPKFVNIIRFYSLIYKYASKDSIFVSDGGGNTFFSSLQNIRIKTGQRSITSGGSGCMVLASHKQ